MSTFAGISLTLQAILCNQKAMEVVGHNVANANASGYHRQEVVMKAGPNQTSMGLYTSTVLGTNVSGVVVDKIRRYTSELIDVRYRWELNEAKRWDLEDSVIEQVEDALAETSDSGLSTILSEFWSGWKALATDPEDSAMRADLLEDAQDLALAINDRANRLHQIRIDQSLEITSRIEEINALANEIAMVNGEVGKSGRADLQSNDMQDELDRLTNRLVEIVGAEVHYEGDGKALVSIGGHVLVQGTRCNTILEVNDPANNNLPTMRWSEGVALTSNNKVNFYSGEMMGLMDVRDEIIPQQLDYLNKLTRSLVTEVNALHSAGRGLSDNVSREFFVTGAGGFDPTNADPNYMIGVTATLKVNTDLDPDQGGSLNNIAASAAAGTPGDGSVAEAIYGLLEDKTIDFGDVGAPADITTSFTDYNARRVSSLSLHASKAISLNDAHANLLDSLTQQRESIIGVNLDEEATSLVKYQKAYEAAARVMTALDEMLDVIVNKLGTVGL